MSLETPRYKLHAALEVLRGRWDEARDHWQDAVRQEFEKEFWQPLEPSVVALLAAMDGLAQVLHQVRRDCDDD
jgi:hypothetical protein